MPIYSSEPAIADKQGEMVDPKDSLDGPLDKGSLLSESGAQPHAPRAGDSDDSD